MAKKIFVNIILLFTTYVVPLYIFRYYQDEYRNVNLRQYTVFTVLFFGSILVTYLNNKYRKLDVKNKWLWILFELIGIVGLCYSVFVLFLLFSLRNLLN